MRGNLQDWLARLRRSVHCDTNRSTRIWIHFLELIKNGHPKVPATTKHPIIHDHHLVRERRKLTDMEHNTRRSKIEEALWIERNRGETASRDICAKTNPLGLIQGRNPHLHTSALSSNSPHISSSKTLDSTPTPTTSCTNHLLDPHTYTNHHAPQRQEPKLSKYAAL